MIKFAWLIIAGCVFAGLQLFQVWQDEWSLFNLLADVATAQAVATASVVLGILISELRRTKPTVD